MGAEVPALIVCIVISLAFNVGFIIYLFIKNQRKIREYKKVENLDVENHQKDGQTSLINKNPLRSPEKGNETKDSEQKIIGKVDPPVGNLNRSDQVDGMKEPQQRSDRQRLQEPVGRHEFVRFMNSVVQFINEYFDESHKQPVVPEHDVNSARIHVKPPEKPEELDEIIKDLKEVVIPNICHTHHPRYHAKFAGKSLADIIGSTISAALGPDVSSSPIINTIERLICKWLSSTMAISQMKTCTNELCDPIGTVFYTPRDVFTSVVRHAIRKFEKNNVTEKERSSRCGDYVVYCSDDAQVALAEACMTTKVKLRKVTTYESNSSGMTSANLSKQIEKDLERGYTPLVIIANYGSANVAANDEVWDLVTISRKRKIWLHLDATYAGCEWLDPNCRNNVHSLVSDVHSVHIVCSSLFPYSGRISIVWSCENLELDGCKCMNVQRSMWVASCLLGSLPNVRRCATNLDPCEALDVSNEYFFEGDLKVITAKIHYGEHPIRLWILIRLHGIRSIREAVKRKIILGNAFAERISHHPEFFELHHPNEHGVAVFRYNNKTILNRAENTNKITSMFHNYLVSSSSLKFTLLSFHGKVLIKAVINYGRCNLSIMEESVSTLLNSVEEFEEAMKKKKKVSETPKSDFCEMIGGSPNETTDVTQPEEDVKSNGKK